MNKNFPKDKQNNSKLRKEMLSQVLKETPHIDIYVRDLIIKLDSCGYGTAGEKINKAKSKHSSSAQICDVFNNFLGAIMLIPIFVH